MRDAPSAPPRSQAAAAMSERAFTFLVEEYGYELLDVRCRYNGLSVRYVGPVMGVLIDWYPRDPPTVWLVRLADGGFPDRPVSVGPDTPLAYFDLSDTAAISGYQPEVPDRVLDTPDSEAFEALGETLRVCAADLLSGDLSRVPLLERRIRDRTRAMWVARYGVDGARELGW